VKLGFHLPLSKGFRHLWEELRALGCEAVQIFAKNPRSWQGKEWSDEERFLARELAEEIPLFVHLSYLPNLGKADEDPRHLEALLHEARLAAEIGARGLVVHCGSREDRAKGLAALRLALNRTLEQSPVTIFLENSAGQGRSLGSSLEELAEILEGISARDRTLLCLDTAHLYAAGFPLASQEDYEDAVFRVRMLVGLDRVGLFHLNDSKTACGSRVDRHWHIGHGHMGREPFGMIINDKRFAHLCGIMETPKMGNWDRENMETMRSLLSPLVSRPSS
jgi:apurinic endonuclease APN1